MSEAITKTGGCQCGAVRYSVSVVPSDAYLCHCRMCQRATGNVSIAFVSVKRVDCKWEGEPDWYRSSPIALRPFCSRCGTPLGFQFDDDGDWMDLTVGSFDNPEDFRPKHHFGAESIHPAWLDTGGLPRLRADEYDVLVKKWEDVAGGVSK